MKSFICCNDESILDFNHQSIYKSKEHERVSITGDSLNIGQTTSQLKFIHCKRPYYRDFLVIIFSTNVC